MCKLARTMKAYKDDYKDFPSSPSDEEVLEETESDDEDPFDKAKRLDMYVNPSCQLHRSLNHDDFEIHLFSNMFKFDGKPKWVPRATKTKLSKSSLPCASDNYFSGSSVTSTQSLTDSFDQVC